jgi:hypothetical protein
LARFAQLADRRIGHSRAPSRSSAQPGADQLKMENNPAGICLPRRKNAD